VYGLQLLTDCEGVPISIEVFEGNRSDSTTVAEQVEKLAKRFGITEIILVGDKGMIKRTQIKSFKENTHYITSITQHQIRSLVKEGVFQLSLFENDLLEVEHEKVRYVLRKNPIRSEEMKFARQERIDYLIAQIKTANLYLEEHLKAGVETQTNKLQKRIKSFQLSSFCQIESKDRVLTLVIDTQKRSDLADFDGCYVIKTDVSKDVLSTQKVHQCYKGLAQVEHAFRTIKTGCLEVRPVYVRKETRTRGHVFIAMLAYMVIQALWEAVKPLGLTLNSILDYILQLQTTILSFGGTSVKKIQSPSSKCAAIFNALNLKIPNLKFSPVA